MMMHLLLSLSSLMDSLKKATWLLLLCCSVLLWLMVRVPPLPLESEGLGATAVGCLGHRPRLLILVLEDCRTGKELL